MPEPTEQASKPLRTWRPMAAWTAAILLALGLIWFVAAAVVPVWQVRSRLNGLGHFEWKSEQIEDAAYNHQGLSLVAEVGGQRRCAWALRVYVSLMPENLAPRKYEAVRCAAFCGEPGRALLESLQGSADPDVRQAAAEALKKIRGEEAKQ